MDESKRLRMLDVLARRRRLDSQQANMDVLRSAQEKDSAATEHRTRQSDLHVLARWRADALAQPRLDLSALQQASIIQAEVNQALTDAQARLKQSTAMHAQALQSRLQAKRREDSVLARRDEAQRVVQRYEWQRESEQSVETWLERTQA